MTSNESPEGLPDAFSNRGEWILARRIALIGGVVLLAALYIFTSPANRTEADDAFWYAWDVETQPWSGLLHPHHLLYLPIARVTWLAVRFLGVADRAYPVMVAAGAVAAAAAVVVSWDTLVRRADFEGIRATLTVGLLAFSYGFWRYSAEAEVYALALLWCAALVNLALASRLGRRGGLALVLLGATAPLVHILTAALAGIAAPVAIGLRRGWRSAMSYVAVAGSIGLALAAAGYRLASQPGDGMLAFYMGGKSAGGIDGAGGAAKHVVAAAQAVVSGNFLFMYPSFREQFASWFPTRMLADELYAGVHATVAIKLLAPLTLGGLLFASIWFLHSGRSTWAHRHRGPTGAVALALVWLMLHVGLGLRFSRAGNPEYWLLSLLPAWLLFACIFVPPVGKRLSAPLLALVIALFAHNLVGGLWVYHSPDGDRGLAKGGWLIENTTSEDAVLTADSPVFFRYLRYRAPSTVIDLQGRTEEELREIWAGGPDVSGLVFATDDVFRPADYYRALRPAEADGLREFGQTVEYEFERIVADEFGGIWKWTAGQAAGSVVESGP